MSVIALVFRTLSLRHFGSKNGPTRSATFHTRHDFGTMTLGRHGKTSGYTGVVPSDSRATLESRYSGNYELAGKWTVDMINLYDDNFFFFFFRVSMNEQLSGVVQKSAY